MTREAVKMLTAKGLLSARPRQGTIVQPSSSWNLFDTDVLRWLLERKFSVELLKHFNQLRVAIEPEAAALAAVYADADERKAISAGLARMEAAEDGQDNTLDADIAFHVAVLKASKNPFFAQFQDVVATALRSSIQFTNRIKGRSASVSAHAAVRDAIMKRSPEGARTAMRKIISDVLVLIDDAGDLDKKAAKPPRPDNEGGRPCPPLPPRQNRVRRLIPKVRSSSRTSWGNASCRSSCRTAPG